VPEPQSHFQLSFTARQALLLFVCLFLALGVAYFLGVMTGLAGRSTESVAATAAPTAPPVSEPTEAPAAVAAVRPTPEGRRTSQPAVAFPKPVLGTEPTTPSLQLFEDRGGAAPTPAPRAAKATSVPAAAPSGEFWVQVVSVSSEKEARAVSQRLSRRGHHVSVSAAVGPKGTVYRVRAGPFRSREQAGKIAEQLSLEERVQTWIVPAGK
jgi:DedD protein